MRTQNGALVNGTKAETCGSYPGGFYFDPYPHGKRLEVKSLSLGWVHEIDTAPPFYYARRFKTSFCGKAGLRVVPLKIETAWGVVEWTVPAWTRFGNPRFEQNTERSPVF